LYQFLRCFFTTDGEAVVSGSADEHDRTPVNRLTPWRFVFAFGVVSMLADLVYESARAITGPYLATLGAGAGVVGVVTGAGEAVALVLRLLSGPLSDRTRRYWPITITGYVMTVVAVPLLAVTQTVTQAAAAVITKRFGKAVRTPARDTMLAAASTGTGRVGRSRCTRRWISPGRSSDPWSWR
jgi:MFS family permease